VTLWYVLPAYVTVVAVSVTVKTVGAIGLLLSFLQLELNKTIIIVTTAYINNFFIVFAPVF
jgi:hypothetical protein